MKAVFSMTAAVAVLSLGFVVAAQDRSADRMTPGSSDRTFMMKAAQGGMAEVELGKLAVEKGHSQAVKDFGQRMVDDHSKAGDELKSLAAQKRVVLPPSISAKDAAIQSRLSRMNGDEFDRAYIHDMVEDHKEDVAEFQNEANSGHDPDVKAWAGKTLPTLQSHLHMAMQDEK